jgi:peptidoglycan hydrolase CwlO-like protein
MTLIKRGLGRGLEVLLADVSTLAGMQQATTAANDMDEQLAVAQSIIASLHKQNQQLLSEIESLKQLLDELESFIRADES